MRVLWSRLLGFLFAKRLDRDLDRQVQSHLGLLAEDLQRQGMTAEEARLVALQRFGSVSAIQEQYREARGLPLAETVWKELALAARVLGKSPGFAAAAVVTIAVGIGVSTAIFSVVNAVLLRPLGYGDPDRLVLVLGEFRKRGVTEWPFSDANYVDLREGTRASLENIGGLFTYRAVLRREDGAPEHVSIALVTPSLFRVLGARIVLGRDFVESDAVTRTKAGPQPPPTAAILSHEYWQRRYGADPAILGRQTRTGAHVTGVLSPGFGLALPPSFNADRNPDIFLPARLDYDAAERNNVTFRVIGRLKGSASLDRARADAESVAANIRKADRNHDTADFRIGVEPMHRYLVSTVRPTVLALMGAAALLLLIACANVANLLLVRALGRERESAVRAALGGHRWRLLAHALAEAVLLAGLGAVAGLGLAWAGVRYLIAKAPSSCPVWNPLASTARPSVSRSCRVWQS